jgi:glycerate dehydrogenase
LRLVAVLGTGYDHIDVPACVERGVSVFNERDWTVSLPEHVFALILALRRQLLSYRQVVEDGTWGRSNAYAMLLDPLPRALAGGTMGLIGYGALARKVETIAVAFGMKVLIAERKGATEMRPGRTPFDEVMAQSDVLVILCPLNNETRDMVGEKELATMPSDALVINGARGGIVDEAALAAAVRSGKLGGAAADALVDEPPKNGSPLVGQDLPNIIVTPHVSWVSIESLETLADQLIGNLEAFIEGTPRNLITSH